MQAIKEAPRPTNASELKAYLGILTYNSKFLPTVLAPLYRLLRKDVPWQWKNQEEKASKDRLTSQPLVHFDSKLKLILACDASAYGVGAVLAHQLPD